MYFSEKGCGYPVLMGHSYLFDSRMWQPQTEILSRHYRVITPDLWGHGASPELPADVKSVHDMARDHLQLMDMLGIDKFAIVGLSVGGMWGAELAAMAPNRVEALVMMDSYVGSELPEEKQKYIEMLDAVEASGSIRSPLLEYIVSRFFSATVPMAEKERLSYYLASLSPSVLRNSIVPVGRMIFGRPDRMDILDRIHCPVLVAHGEDDLPRPLDEGREMAERLGCRFVLIPGAGHISNIENPDFVNKMLSYFLEENISL